MASKNGGSGRGIKMAALGAGIIAGIFLGRWLRSGPMASVGVFGTQTDDTTGKVQFDYKDGTFAELWRLGGSVPDQLAKAFGWVGELGGLNPETTEEIDLGSLPIEV